MLAYASGPAVHHHFASETFARTRSAHDRRVAYEPDIEVMLTTVRYTRVRLFAAAVAFASTLSVRAQRYEEPQYAPADAWLPGEKLPYYGSENPWNRRFFTVEQPPRIGQPQLLLLLDG